MLTFDALSCLFSWNLHYLAMWKCLFSSLEIHFQYFSTKKWSLSCCCKQYFPSKGSPLHLKGPSLWGGPHPKYFWMFHFILINWRGFSIPEFKLIEVKLMKWLIKKNWKLLFKEQKVLTCFWKQHLHCSPFASLKNRQALVLPLL